MLAGWSVSEMDMGGAEPYRVCMVGDEAKCGIMGRTPEMGDAPSHWMTYIAVDDVDKSAKVAAKHGGKVVQPPFDIPQVGRIAMIQDPTGAMVGLITPA
jgi:predicted enzyme related to lactoylglutathione lyase